MSLGERPECEIMKIGFSLSSWFESSLDIHEQVYKL
jgi:hypothetical protein